MGTLKPWLRHWPKNVAHSINYPNISLGEMLQKSTKIACNSTAIFYENIALTYNQLDHLVDSFGRAVQDMGVSKGDRVALYLPNIPQFVIAYYGALRIGATIVSCSPLFKDRELAYIVNDSGSKVLIFWNKLEQHVQAAKQKTRLEHVICTSLDDLLAAQGKGLTDDRTERSSTRFLDLVTRNDYPKLSSIKPAEDLALLQYTGGTTGTPKGAMLTHRNLVVNAVQFATWLNMRPGREVHLSVLPFFHIYGMTAAMNAPIYTSSTMVLVSDPRNTKSILNSIDRYKPTIFCGVPASYIALINSPDVQHHNIRSIRTCISGAAPLTQEIQRKFEELTGGRLVEGYGLTEAGPVTHVNPLDDPKKNRPGSIGIPISDTECKIVDMESGEVTLPPLEAGELAVKGPQVMRGYWNMPHETSLALRDGWLFTGDIAVMEKDGYFRILDRKKDMINVSGFKVYPREVEEVLCEHPAIKEAAAVASSDSDSGETVKAHVVLKDSCRGRVSSAEIVAFCRERLADYKIPRILEFVEVLPKSSVGKILRKDLRTQKGLDRKSLKFGLKS
jgi:long-chain acyl-CoA synthetase